MTNALIAAFILFVVMITAKAISILSPNILDWSLFLILLNTLEWAICLWLLNSNYGKSIYSLVMSLFCSVLFLYNTIPLVFTYFEANVFPFHPPTVLKTLWCESVSFTVFFFATFCLISVKMSMQTEAACRRWLADTSVRVFGLSFVAFVGLAIAILYYYNFQRSGALVIIDTATRVELSNVAETGKTWLIQYAFVAWAMAFITIMFTHPKALLNAPVAAAFSLIACALFVYVYLSLGNRREMAILLIYIMLIATGRMRSRILIFIAPMFPLLLATRLLTSFSDFANNSVDDKEFILNAFGEFVFPHFPLMYYIETNDWPLLFGSSYFYLPFNALPNFGMWEKVETLSVQFARVYSLMGMGYAFTPFTEGFRNFYWFSLITTPLLLSLTVFVFTRASRFTILPFLLMFSMSFDICRGEFTPAFLQGMIFISIIAVLLKMTLKKRVIGV